MAAAAARHGWLYAILSSAPRLHCKTLTLTPIRPPLSSHLKRIRLSSVSGSTPDPSQLSELQLYNTKTRRKEQFKPLVPGKVGMYVCGVTPYDDSHIGHARAYVAFDVLYRYLRYLGYEVCYVRNFTDIDDKIIARANKLGEDPLQLSSRYCDDFHSDMCQLQCLPPSAEPRVTNHIGTIINMIKQILDNGYAYTVEGDVYFSIDKFPNYGELSGRKVEANRAGERVAVDERKINPADFALWKAAKEGEPSWDSPWGPGRPGWHIECSAMSAEYLGRSFDIHGGGEDLIFPHHENELAQSTAACCSSSVSYWLHNGFVNVNGQKMSKSLGNFVTIRQVLELYHPLALRLLLLGTHYRSPINYTEALLDVASDQLFYIYQTLWECQELCQDQHHLGSASGSLPLDISQYIRKLFQELDRSMLDDLHTSVVLGALSDPLKVINDLLHTRKGKKRQYRIESLSALGKNVGSVLSVVGLMPTSYIEALQQLRAKALKRACLREEDVLQKIEERTAARKAKQYERSDEIRRELAVVGIALMDGPDGTTWRPSALRNEQQQEVSV